MVSLRHLRVLALALSGLILLLAAPTAQARPCAGATAQPSNATLGAVRQATLCLVNRERARRRLPALRSHRRLGRPAGAHAADMVAHRYFAHDSRSGKSVTDRLRASGFVRPNRSWAVGENIAWGAASLSTARSIVAAWMKSPPHRAAILDRRFRHAGIGIALGLPSGATEGATYVLDFGN
jgi:uncharacterized protein YkwD